MTHAAAHLPVTAERIERGLLQLARIIADVDQAEALQLAPIYDRLERELEAMTTNDVRSRALRRLAATAGSDAGAPRFERSDEQPANQLSAAGQRAE